MKRKGAYIIDTETWKLGSNGSCTLYRNSYMNGENKKVPVSVVDYRILPKCSLKVTGALYDSLEALVNDSTSSVFNNWKIGILVSLLELALEDPIPRNQSLEYKSQNKTAVPSHAIPSTVVGGIYCIVLTSAVSF